MMTKEVRSLTQEEDKTNEEHYLYKSLCKESFLFDQELSKAKGDFYALVLTCKKF